MGGGYSPAAAPLGSSSPPRSPGRLTSFAEQVAAMQAALRQKASQLAAQLAAQAQQERNAKAIRLQLGADISTLTGMARAVCLLSGNMCAT